MAVIVLVLVLYVLTVCRVTRVIVGDKITEPFRNRIVRRFGQASQLTYLFFCAWCMSIWIGFGTAWAVFLLTDLSWWLYPLVALSASQLTGLLHRAEED
ncbi:hypothetical protein [Rhodococcus koreensis]